MEFFPSLLKDPKVPEEDKEKINNLLQKPFNPYVRRHSSLTEKSRILKFHTFHQHAGWTPGSQMHLKYTHYFGNESSEELLESYGIETRKDKKNSLDVLLKPKQCPNCNESNIPNSKFCSKCRMVLTYDAYSETLESEKQKEDKLTIMEKQFNAMQSQMQSLISAFSNIKDQTQVDGMAKTLYGSGLIKEATTTTTTTTAASSSSVETEAKKETPTPTTLITTTDLDGGRQQQNKQEKQKKKLIKEAGKAAYHATITKSTLSSTPAPTITQGRGIRIKTT
jgi:ribosomal protein L37AE/L43A